MSIRIVVLSLMLSVPVTALAASEANTFLLVNSSGKTIGNASYSIDKTKNGVKIRSRFDYRLSASDLKAVTADMPTDAGPADAAAPAGRRGGGGPLGQSGVEGQYNAEYKVDANGDFMGGYIESSATQLMTSYEPTKKRDAMTISQMQGGSVGNNNDTPLAKPDFLLAPGYDPSVVQALFTAALAHPHADSTYLLLVPAPSSPANVIPMYVAIQPALTNPSLTAALDGKSITVRHYLMNFHTGHADIYLDEAGELMQADMGPLHASYVRTRFVLGAH